MSPSDKSRDQHGSRNPISEEENDSKKMTPPKKVYTNRNSVLTDLMQVNHLQTVYNIAVAVFNLCVLNAVLYYLAAPKMFQRDLATILWGAGGVKLFIVMWLSFNIYAFCILLGFKTWVRMRRKIHTKLADTLFLIGYALAIVFMFVATTRVMLKSSFRPMSNFAIMCEQVRIFMKIYSFVKESAPRVLQYKPAKDGPQESNLYPTTKHFTYFLFAPVLIYRDSYPRKKDLDWDFVLHNLFKFFACIFITYCIFTRFVVDVFSLTGVRLFTLQEGALVLCGAMVVGSLMMFLMFYGILHSWLNVFAEMLQFGDREFYQVRSTRIFNGYL
ncbi:hypothetical protein JTE90_005003 [Oedothorax gibbosus]|uniref:Uncharacterized protein n=1 Tax=Oedothorax gibbosus TaxID=931172 RepID=A0AAV6VCI9_9ARAC|nr:hypothetical protein JTE90_005003 [Oedothorax gibbosus]